MKKIFIIILAVCAPLAVLFGQTAADVLENGIKLNSGKNLFFRYGPTGFLFQPASRPEILNFKNLPDSAIFLPIDGSVNFYMVPVNPLTYSTKIERSDKVDPIVEKATAALGSIGETIIQSQNDFIASNKKSPAKKSNGSKKTNASAINILCDFTQQVNMYNKIADKMKDNQKDKINGLFNMLKLISFDDQEQTKSGLQNIGASIDEIKNYFDQLKLNIQELAQSVSTISCQDKSYEFIVVRDFNEAVQNLQSIFEIQQKRLTNLQKIYQIVTKAKDNALNLGWNIKIGEEIVNKGRVSTFTIKIYEDGYKLSQDDNEIVAYGPNEPVSKTVRLRRFNRFIPEVSAGFAYTNLTYSKYGTTTDAATGNQVVSDAGTEAVKRLNFTAMVNYNVFISHSDLHPFWQIGTGLNTGFPTILMGVGLRINTAPAKRLAVSVGLATTWLKVPDKLKIGDEVSGPAEVEKDLIYKFNEKPKIYFGIQYNF